MLNESMTSKRFVVLSASIFLLGAMPFLIMQPNGSSSAGLSAGFTFPIERVIHLMALLGLGVYASYVRGNAVLLMPLSFLFLFVVGMALSLGQQPYALLPMFAFGAVVLFSISLAITRSRRAIMGMVVVASSGFHFGMYYASFVPDIASPLYFLIGNILSISLIFATAVSFGLTMRNDKEAI